MNRKELRKLLVDRFSESEIRDLCFQLEVDYESLPGSSKSDKARELILHLEGHGAYIDLVIAVQEARPSSPPGEVDRSPAASPSPSLPADPLEFVLADLMELQRELKQHSDGENETEFLIKLLNTRGLNGARIAQVIRTRHTIQNGGQKTHALEDLVDQARTELGNEWQIPI
jgi:hypothetical protein